MERAAAVTLSLLLFLPLVGGPVEALPSASPTQPYFNLIFGLIPSVTIGSNLVRHDGWQADGGSAGDASDICTSPSPTLPATGSRSGIVVPGQDPRDFYAYVVASATGTVDITLDVLNSAPSNSAVPYPDLNLFVLPPGCLSIVASSTNPGTSLEHVAFTPPVTGTYSVLVHLELPSVLAAPTPGGPGPGNVEACSPLCSAVGSALNGVIGYSLTTVRT